jgi:integrase
MFGKNQIKLTIAVDIDVIYAARSVRLEDLLQFPGAVVAQAGGEPLAILSENRPLFYLLTPPAWQRTVLGQGGEAAHPPLPSVPAPGLAQAMGPVAVCGTPPSPAPQNHDRFLRLSEQLLEAERARVQRGELCQASLGICRNRLDAHVLPWFGQWAPSQVTADALDGFVNRLGDAGMSTTTISQYMVVVRKLLKLAVRQGLLREIPEMPKVRVVNRPRAMFTAGDYLKLIQTARRLEFDGKKAPKLKEGNGARAKFWVQEKHLQLPPDMRWVIAFMVNSFVRPSDIRQLRHKHVQIVRGAHVYLRLTLPESKRHDRPVVTLRPAVRVFEAALARNRALGLDGPDDHVFLPEISDRAYALATLGFWFKWVLREAGLSQVDHLGRQRTIYSLRHTAIMFRLLYGQGIDTLTLARNARTSVQMIERFYASTLQGEMNVDMLQSRRGSVRNEGGRRGGTAAGQ